MKKAITVISLAVCLICGAVLLAGCGSERAPSASSVQGSASEEISAPALPEETASPDTEEQSDEPPFFLRFFSPATVEIGDEFDLHEYISYIDDLDPDVELTVEGEVDTETVGEYLLKLTLTDDSGNTAYDEFSVSVVEPQPQDTSDDSAQPEPPQSFAEFTEKYKKDGASVGIDVSRWQGEIDFGRVAEAGCEFVIIRVGGYAEGQFEDAYFAQNISRAKAAGLKVGVYWYSEENGPEAVRENAEYLYSLLDGAELDFPVFFDWEDFASFEDYKMSMRDLNEMFSAFREEAESRGYRAALYNSGYYLRTVWSDGVKSGGVWLANYVEQTTYEGEFFLWQQGLGRIDGIDGDVDVDVFYPARLGD